MISEFIQNKKSAGLSRQKMTGVCFIPNTCDYMVPSYKRLFTGGVEGNQKLSSIRKWKQEYLITDLKYTKLKSPSKCQRADNYTSCQFRRDNVLVHAEISDTTEFQPEIQSQSVTCQPSGSALRAAGEQT